MKCLTSGLGWPQESKGVLSGNVAGFSEPEAKKALLRLPRGSFPFAFPQQQRLLSGYMHVSDEMPPRPDRHNQLFLSAS